MTVYDTNVRYTMFSIPLVPQFISIVTVFWANKQDGSIFSHTLTETLSKCASRHFQKRTNSHQAARSFTPGVVWVPSTSASRIANTVWWFMAPIKPSQEFLQLDLDVAYPPTRHRPDPQS